MSLKAVLANSMLLKDVVDSMKDLVKDVNFDFNESGLQVQCTDSSNVGLVFLKMHEAAFESFTCTKAMTIGVNAESFAKILKICGPMDKLTMEAEGDATTLDFTFESSADDRLAQFKMKTVVVEQDTLGVPDADYDAVITMPSGEFKKAVSELKDAGDNVILNATNEGLRLVVDGEMGKGEILLKPRQGATVEESLQLTTLKEEVTNGFGMRYVNLFMRAASLCKTCTLSMKNQDPMVLSFSIGEVSHGFLRFVLAPKLDE